MPTFTYTEYWLNRNEKFERDLECQFAGLPSLICFWAVSCPTCHYNMPAVKALHERYSRHGLRTIFVHLPRGEEDLDITAVIEAAAEMGMREPCAIDNDHLIGQSFETGGVWPTYFLFDSESKLRCRAAGVFGVKMMERTLARMFPNTPELEAASRPSGKNGAGGCR